ncbi:MAG TPA: signal peptidase I [Acidimicrobiales bacterium]|nr:signal peptidase I [Acidimicrobiales bacterium]
MNPSSTYLKLRRLLGVFSLVLVVGLGGALATKRIGYVVTSGVSMQPLYHAGDLVIVAKADSYQVGEIAAYRGGAGKRTVALHRIVGGDAGGFEMKGDNNQSVDPLRPTSDELIGRAVVHVPKVGAALKSPLTRAAVLLVVALALGLLIFAPSSKTVRQAPAAPRPPTAKEAWKALVVLDVVLAAVLGLAHLRADTPAAPPPEEGTTQTGALAYQANVPVSDTYPTGRIATGDPVFVKLLSNVGVTFRYSTDAPPQSVTGTASLDLELSNASGWRTKFPMTTTSLAGGHAELTGVLDLPRIQAVADGVARTIGAGVGSTVNLKVIGSASVSVDGAKPVEYSSELPLKLSSTALTLDGVKPTATPDGPVVTSEKPLTPPPPPAPEPKDPSSDLRKALLVALLAAVVITVVVWPESDGDKGPATIPAVDADLADTTRIRVADDAALETLATTVNEPIVEGEDGWKAVVTPSAIYWTGAALPAPAPATLQPARRLRQAVNGSRGD